MNLSPLFAGIRVRNAWYTPAEFQTHPVANIELELSDEEVRLNPDLGGTDHFQLIRRGDSGKFQVNSMGAGRHNDRINMVGDAHVKPLLEALEAGSVSFAPDVNQERYQKALARLKE